MSTRLYARHGSTLDRRPAPQKPTRWPFRLFLTALGLTIVAWVVVF